MPSGLNGQERAGWSGKEEARADIDISSLTETLHPLLHRLPTDPLRRWQKGGLNASLTEPDYLTCSITKTTTYKTPRHHPQRPPTLTFARTIDKLRVKHQPMAAIKPQNEYAAEDPVRQIKAKSGAQQVRPAPQQEGALLGVTNLQDLLPKDKATWDKPKGQLPLAVPPNPFINQDRRGGPLAPEPAKAKTAPLDDTLASFDPSHLPSPPSWLVGFVGQNIRSLPLSTKDDALLGWFRQLKEPILRASRLRNTQGMSLLQQAKEKRRTNADRFRLDLPPLPPKGLKRPFVPNPFRIPGIEYTEEEIEAMGWNDDKKKADKEKAALAEFGKEDTSTGGQIWTKIIKEAIMTTLPASSLRPDVMEALWLLLDIVAQADDVSQQPLVQIPAHKGSINRQAGPVPHPQALEEMGKAHGIVLPPRGAKVLNDDDDNNARVAGAGQARAPAAMQPLLRPHPPYPKDAGEMKAAQIAANRIKLLQQQDASRERKFAVDAEIARLEGELQQLLPDTKERDTPAAIMGGRGGSRDVKPAVPKGEPAPWPHLQGADDRAAQLLAAGLLKPNDMQKERSRQQQQQKKEDVRRFGQQGGTDTGRGDYEQVLRALNADSRRQAAKHAEEVEEDGRSEGNDDEAEDGENPLEALRELLDRQEKELAALRVLLTARDSKSRANNGGKNAGKDTPPANNPPPKQPIPDPRMQYHQQQQQPQQPQGPNPGAGRRPGTRDMADAIQRLKDSHAHNALGDGGATDDALRAFEEHISLANLEKAKKNLAQKAQPDLRMLDIDRGLARVLKDRGINF